MRNLSRIYVHLVWGTWDRLPLITAELERTLYSTLLAECSRLGGEMIAIGGMPDHVHMLVRMPSTVSVAQLVKQLKGASSHLVTHEVQPGEFFKWQGGYAAFSVSRWDVPKIRGYIRRQKEHHGNATTRATFELPASP